MKLTSGTVAAVTGAGSGIGRALALSLGGRGCALALADINAAKLSETESLRAELQGTPISVSCVHPGGVRTNIAVNARASMTDPVRLEAGRKRWEKLLKMPPEEAAAAIIRGIERDSARILIGNDARLLDALARLPGLRGCSRTR